MGQAQCCEALDNQSVVKDEYKPDNINLPPPHYAVKI